MSASEVVDFTRRVNELKELILPNYFEYGRKRLSELQREYYFDRRDHPCPCSDNETKELILDKLLRGKQVAPVFIVDFGDKELQKEVGLYRGLILGPACLAEAITDAAKLNEGGDIPVSVLKINIPLTRETRPIIEAIKYYLCIDLEKPIRNQQLDFLMNIIKNALRNNCEGLKRFLKGDNLNLVEVIRRYVSLDSSMIYRYLKVIREKARAEFTDLIRNCGLMDPNDNEPIITTKNGDNNVSKLNIAINILDKLGYKGNERIRYAELLGKFSERQLISINKYINKGSSKDREELINAINEFFRLNDTNPVLKVLNKLSCKDSLLNIQGIEELLSTLEVPDDKLCLLKDLIDSLDSNSLRDLIKLVKGNRVLRKLILDYLSSPSSDKVAKIVEFVKKPRLPREVSIPVSSEDEYEALESIKRCVEEGSPLRLCLEPWYVQLDINTKSIIDYIYNMGDKGSKLSEIMYPIAMVLGRRINEVTEDILKDPSLIRRIENTIFGPRPNTDIARILSSFESLLGRINEPGKLGMLIELLWQSIEASKDGRVFNATLNVVKGIVESVRKSDARSLISAIRLLMEELKPMFNEDGVLIEAAHWLLDYENLMDVAKTMKSKPNPNDESF